ncbi:hypothetical protein D3C76_1376610 [compost metagenome]
MGSLLPDSASNVDVIRLRIFFPPSTENTAAASVDPTMAPNRKDSAQSTPRIYLAHTPTTNVVINTPTVARDNADPMTGFISAIFVCIPPSNKITIKAKIPTS